METMILTKSQYLSYVDFCTYSFCNKYVYMLKATGTISPLDDEHGQFPER